MSLSDDAALEGMLDSLEHEFNGTRRARSDSRDSRGSSEWAIGADAERAAAGGGDDAFTRMARRASESPPNAGRRRARGKSPRPNGSGVVDGDDLLPLEEACAAEADRQRYRHTYAVPAKCAYLPASLRAHLCALRPWSLPASLAPAAVAAAALVWDGSVPSLLGGGPVIAYLELCHRPQVQRCTCLGLAFLTIGTSCFV